MVDDVTETEALKKIEANLSKNPRRAKGAPEDGATDDTSPDTDDEEPREEAA